MGDRRFGLFIFGDEILSGKRHDLHFEKVREILASHGLALSFVHYLGDDRPRCVAALRQSFGSGDIVFACGGIGSTPDDHTRQAAAEALGLPLELHPEAEACIRQRVAEAGQPVTPERLQMGEFPRGAEIIPNPYNRIPGFSIRDHHFVPGFPVMAWPMIEGVLQARYRDRFRAVAEFDRSMIVPDFFEATVTPLMRAIAQRYPQLRIYSLPSVGEAGLGRHLELGLKAEGLPGSDEPPEALLRAYEEFREGVVALGGAIAEERQARR